MQRCAAEFRAAKVAKAAASSRARTFSFAGAEDGRRPSGFRPSADASTAHA